MGIKTYSYAGQVKAFFTAVKSAKKTRAQIEGVRKAAANETTVDGLKKNISSLVKLNLETSNNMQAFKPRFEYKGLLGKIFLIFDYLFNFGKKRNQLVTAKADFASTNQLLTELNTKLKDAKAKAAKDAQAKEYFKNDRADMDLRFVECSREIFNAEMDPVYDFMLKAHVSEDQQIELLVNMLRFKKTYPDVKVQLPQDPTALFQKFLTAKSAEEIKLFVDSLSA